MNTYEDKIRSKYTIYYILLHVRSNRLINHPLIVALRISNALELVIIEIIKSLVENMKIKNTPNYIHQ